MPSVSIGASGVSAGPRSAASRTPSGTRPERPHAPVCRQWATSARPLARPAVGCDGRPSAGRRPGAGPASGRSYSGPVDAAAARTASATAARRPVGRRSAPVARKVWRVTDTAPGSRTDPVPTASTSASCWPAGTSPPTTRWPGRWSTSSTWSATGRPARRSSSTPPTASTSCSASWPADGMECVGALATHFHPDHVGGDMMGWGIEGITRLLEVVPVPVHVQADEAPWVARSTGVGVGELAAHARRGRGPGRVRSRSPWSTPRATRRAASASWSTAGWSPATPCSSTGAAGPTCPGATPRPCTSR